MSPRNLKKFWRLDLRLRRLLLQAFAELGLARLRLLARPFKALVAHMTLHRGEPRTTVARSEDLVTAREVGWAVTTAARYTPWRSACLVQVMAAQRMLARRGIPGVFCIGAAKDEEATSITGLAAHAWLKCGDTFVTGEPGHQRYTVLSCFSWSGTPESA